jgi:DNA-binding PadR family transcriptional regulator
LTEKGVKALEEVKAEWNTMVLRINEVMEAGR